MTACDVKRGLLMALLAAAPSQFSACNDSSGSSVPVMKADGAPLGQDTNCQGPGGPCSDDSACCGAGGCDTSVAGASGGGQCSAASFLQNGQACSASFPNAMCMPGSNCLAGTCG